MRCQVALPSKPTRPTCKASFNCTLSLEWAKLLQDGSTTVPSVAVHLTVEPFESRHWEFVQVAAGAAYPPVPPPPGTEYALTDDQRRSLQYSAFSLRRWGWASFWVQLALSLTSTGILLFSVAFTANVRCSIFCLVYSRFSCVVAQHTLQGTSNILMQNVLPVVMVPPVVAEWAKNLAVFGAALHYSILLLYILVLWLHPSLAQVDVLFRGAGGV